MNNPENVILQGNVLDVLKTLPDEFIDCIVTSPPYFNLRDYQTEGIIWDGDSVCEHDWVKHVKKPTGGKGSKTANVGANKNDDANMRSHDIISNFCNKCGAWKGSLGLEPTPDLFIKHLCDIFDEVKRVLKPTGTCWVNLGDSYGTGSGSGVREGKQATVRGIKNFKDWEDNGKAKIPGFEKSLLLIPERFALEMCGRGWILRNKIVWKKNNCMPASVTDRFTVDWEAIFFFTKNKQYFFEQQFEQAKDPEDNIRRLMKAQEYNKNEQGGNSNFNQENRNLEAVTERMNKGRNKRCVWEINTRPNSVAHFACFPPELPANCIKAGCPEQICNKCGQPRQKIYEDGEIIDERDPEQVLRAKNQEQLGQGGLRGGYVKREKIEKGHSDCGCNAGFHSGLVLDIFAGSGTTLDVARKLSMKYLGIELNKEYIEIINKRLAQGMLF